MGPDEFTATIEMPEGTFEFPGIGTVAAADLQAEISPSSITNENFLRISRPEPVLPAVDMTTYRLVNIDNRIEDISIRLGKLDTSDPDTFYEFLRMWPLYNENGKVVALFDTKEHRDQAEARLSKLETTENPRETILHNVFQNRSRKMPVDDVS